ncbi:MAG TPA: cytochrome P450 [Streptosporangiaceae bacterium]|nr:cytochrome P450 [Streptosporangiaceae bacterium]
MPTSYELPLERPDRFQPPPGYADLRRREPVTRVCLPDGGEAWLVTSYDAVKTVLTDARFGVTKPDSRLADDLSPMGEGRNHRRFRQLVSGALTSQRIHAFEPRIEAIAEQLITQMVRHGAPADLVTHLSRPLPLTVMCELLGIQIDDGEKFHHWVEAAVALVVPPDDPELIAEYAATAQQLWEYMTAAVESKRGKPDDGLLSKTLAESSAFSEEEQINVAITVLITGYITTANALSIGLADLATTRGFGGPANDDARDSTVEEMLRRQSGPGNEALPRWAREDVVLGEQQVSAGDLVLARLEAANHDPAAFPEPGTFDHARTANGHLAFGYGRHQCLGAGLARAELRAALRAIRQHCPDLSLAQPPQDIPWTGHPFEDGPASILITW